MILLSYWKLASHFVMHISPIRKGNFQMHLIQNIQSPNPNESCYGSLSDYDNRTNRAMAKLCEAAGESCQICPVHMCQCLGWPIAQPVKLRPSATVAMVCQSKSPASEGSNQFLAPFRSAQPCKKSKKPKVCSGGDVEAKNLGWLLNHTVIAAIAWYIVV